MSPGFTPKIVAALRRGAAEPVYLTADDRWSSHPREAELIEDEAHAQMRLLYAAAQRHAVSAARLAEARPGPQGPEPIA